MNNEKKVEMPLLSQIYLFAALLFPAFGAIIYFVTMNAQLGGIFGALWFVSFLLLWARCLV